MTTIPPPGRPGGEEGKIVGVGLPAVVHRQQVRLYGPDLHPVRDDENLIFHRRSLKQYIVRKFITIAIQKMYV